MFGVIFIMRFSVSEYCCTAREMFSKKVIPKSPTVAFACPFSACHTLVYTYGYTSWLGHANRYTLINTFDFCHHNNTHKPCSVCISALSNIGNEEISCHYRSLQQISVLAITGVASLLIVLPYYLPNFSS